MQVEIFREKWSGGFVGFFRNWKLRRRRDHENGCDLVAIVVVVIVSLQWKCGSEEMPEIP